jgi:transcriptional regulator with XRE-family HTH domain
MTTQPPPDLTEITSPPSTWGDGYERELKWRVWEKRYAAQVLHVAREVRKEKGLSARQLSERLTAAGWPVTVNSVNGIFGKKGRESISVTQVIALAEALDVSPSELLFNPSAERVEARPGIWMEPTQAAAWFLRGVDLAGADADEFRRGVEGSVAYLRQFLKVVGVAYERYMGDGNPEGAPLPFADSERAQESAPRDGSDSDSGIRTA